MTLLLMILLLQDRPVEVTVDAFLRGDAAARAELVKLGAYAIRPLQKARDKSPEKIDTLVLDLKRRHAYPRDSSLPGLLEEKAEFQLTNTAAVDALQRIHDTWGIGVLCDWNELKDKKLTLAKGTISGRGALDSICRDLGLDYGFYHEVVVITFPDVLWPDRKGPPSQFGAPAAERQHRTPAEEETLKRMRDSSTGVDLQGMTAGTMAIYLREISRIPFEIKVEGVKYAAYFRASKRDYFSLLSAATQISGLDFMIDEGTVVVGTRDEIAKKVAGKK